MRLITLAVALGLACQFCVGAASTAQVVQAFAGISQGNGTLPCVNPGGPNGCYGVPNGAVAVQPYHFIPPNQQEYYYAAFQTGNWSGTLSVTFQVLEKNVVIQTVTAPAVSVGTNAVALVSLPQSIPDNGGYIGPAKLTATTTATPAAGGTAVTLASSAALQIVKAGGAPTAIAHGPGLLQVIAGISSMACATGQGPYCYGVPVGAVAVQPYQITTVPAFAQSYFIVIQAEDWAGTVDAPFELIEAGKNLGVVGGAAGTVIPLTTFCFAGGGTFPNNGYVGPASVNITTTATAGQRGSNRTLHSGTKLQIVP